MDYAIIDTTENLLEVIKLTDWQDYEWNDFAVLREKYRRNKMVF